MSVVIDIWLNIGAHSIDSMLHPNHCSVIIKPQLRNRKFGTKHHSTLLCFVQKYLNTDLTLDLIEINSIV